MTDTGPQKSVLRTTMRSRLEGTDAADRAAWSKAVCQHLDDAAEMENARGVMLFLPMQWEVNLFALARRLWAKGKRVYAPGINMQERVLWPVELAPTATPWSPSLKLGEVAGARVPDEAVDVVVLPGLAFDLSGGRLGRGAGFYDRWLAGQGQRAWRVGAAFELQVTASVPMDPHDRRLDALATEIVLRRFEHSDKAR